MNATKMTHFCNGFITILQFGDCIRMRVHKYHITRHKLHTKCSRANGRNKMASIFEAYTIQHNACGSRSSIPW